MTIEPACIFPTLRRGKQLLFLLGLLCLSACPAPLQTKSSGNATFDLGRDERVVVYPPFSCLSKSLSEKFASRSQVMSTFDFQDAIFPWFEPEHAPKDPVALGRLLRRPDVRAKIDDLNVRYVISLTQRNAPGGVPTIFTKPNSEGLFFCGGGAAAGAAFAGCLGAFGEDKKTSLDAEIWDLRKVASVGSFSTEASGTSLGVGVIVPIIFIAYTELEACKKMADTIASSLSSSSRH